MINRLICAMMLVATMMLASCDMIFKSDKSSDSSADTGSGGTVSEQIDVTASAVKPDTFYDAEVVSRILSKHANKTLTYTDYNEAAMIIDKVIERRTAITRSGGDYLSRLEEFDQSVPMFDELYEFMVDAYHGDRLPDTAKATMSQVFERK